MRQINFDKDTKKNNGHKTYRDRLSSRDDKVICEAAQELVNSADNYFDQRIYPNLCACAAIKEGIVPKNFPLPLRLNFPFVKKYLSAMYPVVLQTKTQNKLFFGNIKLTNTDYKDDIFVKCIETMLEKHFYEFNSPNDYFVESDEQIIDFGYSGVKLSWAREYSNIDDIELIEDDSIDIKKKKQQNNEKEQFEVNNQLHFKSVQKIEQKLIADNLNIEVSDIFNLRLDPLAKKPNQLRFVYEYLYPDYDVCVDLFEDFEKHLSFKKDDNTAEASETPGGELKFNMLTPSNILDSQQEAQNPRIIEFWDKWGHRFYFLTNNEGNKIITLLKLKNQAEDFSYLNPYSHKKIPITLLYRKKNRKDCYGTGVINEIIPLYIIMIYLLSLSIIEEIKRVMSPIGIRNTGEINIDELVSAIEGNGRYFTVKGDGDIRQFVYQIQQNSAATLFQLQQYFEGMIQAQTKITDYQIGGSQQQAYNKTLGGIQAIFEESTRQLSFVNLINKQAYKRIVKLGLSIILQKQLQPIIFRMLGEDSTSYIEIKNELDAPINSAKDLIFVNEGTQRKTVLISDLLRFEIDFDLLFEYGGDTYTLARYNEALRLASILIPAGVKINIKRIATKYFERIGLSDCIIDDSKEMKKIMRENLFMQKITENYQLAVEQKLINNTPENYIKYMSTYIPEPDADNDNHQLHYDNQPDGIHRDIHGYYLSVQQQKMEQMRAALEAEQGNIPTQENNVDGRTIVGQKPQTEVRRSGQSTNEMIQSAARQAGNR